MKETLANEESAPNVRKPAGNEQNAGSEKNGGNEKAARNGSEILDLTGSETQGRYRRTR